MDETKRILVGMFNRYPSLATVPADQATAMLAAYLDTLRSFSSREVSSACEAFRSKGSAFPPSADELFAECERQRAAAKKRQEWEAEGRRKLDLSKYRLPPPEKRGYSFDQLADWKLLINHASPYTLRVDAAGRALRIPEGYPGAGQPAAYGYLTPAEAEMVKAAKSGQRHNHREAAE